MDGLAGILISISIIAALSLAVLENPQVHAWIEQQRRALVDLLRSVGQELDPESRRQAEAFAFLNRTPESNEMSRRHGASTATGRSLSGQNTTRRVPVTGPTSASEAEERRRKGREYLAKRNQDIWELQQRVQGGAKASDANPPRSTHFDAMVDNEGKLRVVEGGTFSVQSAVSSASGQAGGDVKEMEGSLTQPLQAGHSCPSPNEQTGNPFGDEHALDTDQSHTPRLQPKTSLGRCRQEVLEHAQISRMPGRFTPQPAEADVPYSASTADSLSYEEQLAIALSLSEAEEAARNPTSGGSVGAVDEREAINAAIQASLEDCAPVSEPLIDFAAHNASNWSVNPGFGGVVSSLSHRTDASVENIAAQEHDVDGSDEIHLTRPAQLTQAHLASLHTGMMPAPFHHTNSRTVAPYDPVREAARLYHGTEHSRRDQNPRSNEHASSTEPHTAPSILDSSSASREASTFGNVSDVEVVDLLGDSDDVSLSAGEGDGIMTPDSWTEVGSRDGETEVEGLEMH